jgi:hypothetical protein
MEMGVSCTALAASAEQQQAQVACENAIRLGDAHKSFGPDVPPGYMMFLCNPRSIERPADYWNCKAERYKAGDNDNFSHTYCIGKN